MKTYSEKLRDPRWQRKRLELFQRDNFKCRRCGDSKKEIQIHHLVYRKGLQPWEYPENAMITLCVVCHKEAEELRDYVCLQLGTSLNAENAAFWAAFARNRKEFKHWSSAISHLSHCIGNEQSDESDITIVREHCRKAIEAIERGRDEWIQRFENDNRKAHNP